MTEILRSRWLKTTGIAFGVLLLIAFAGYQFWEPGWRYDVRGVDVSRHQETIDWPRLANDGTAFAYIKATEGEDWVDVRFSENWQSAGDAEVLRGAYHFFTFCASGADQAANMTATLPDEPGMLPPAVDLEFSGNCSVRPSVEDFRIELGVFLERIEDRYGMQPLIYTNAEFYDAYLAEQPPDVTWWIMSPVWEPWGSPEWTFWQYFPGDRAGVDGRVDRNVFRGTEDELRALTVRQSP
jgi:lysozyme